MTKSPRLAARGQAAFIGLVVALSACVLAARPAACAESAAAGLDFPPTRFAIVDPQTRQVIGHAHYAVEQRDGRETLRGESRYDDGQYDLETDVLESGPPDTPPRLLRFEHSFFNADSSPMLVERADLKSGDAVCIDYRDAHEQTRSAILDFPEDTYAGASLLIPLEFALRAGRRDPIRMHALGCVPGPRLLAVTTRPLGGAPPGAYAPGMVGIEVRPTFGLWDLLLKLFVPKIRAWFDPADRFAYAGGQIERFYRGPWVELVRAPGAPANAARPAPPSKSQN